MSFKKFNEMELALLSAIANITEEDMEYIKMEKGDYTTVSVEDHISIPSYIRKPDASHHAQRRKSTFKKKENRKEVAQNLGYDMSDVSTNKKVEDLLSANHTDQSYFRGDKAERKNMSVKEEVAMMERDAWETARESMMKEHNSILGSIIEDIDNLTLDMKSNEHSIENLEAEYKELEEAMKLVSEKLENAKLRKNGIVAALLQKEYEYRKTSDKLMQEAHRFGW